MVMEKITNDELKKLQKKYGFKFVRINRTDVVNIAKKPTDRMEVIDFETFVASLKKRKLAVYKAGKGDFLKIMKDK